MLLSTTDVPLRPKDATLSLEKPTKKLVLSFGQRLFPVADSTSIKPVPLTKAHFLDAYSKGKWNLSKVPRPACFTETDVVFAPDHYHEASRLKAVKKFSGTDQWKETLVFNKIISRALKTFNVKGASISLVDSKRQVVKYSALLDAPEVPRKVSIDAHAILSSGSFVLLDATKDWRMSRNPLITGFPHIKFYAAVPLTTKFGTVVGAFSIFDQSLKTEFDKSQIEELKAYADEVMHHLGSPSLLVSKNQGTSMENLINIIGRPTSHGNQFLPVAVYEKDGSGSPYSLNHNFRYNGQEATVPWKNILVNEDIVTLLSKFRDVKSASSLLCQVVAQELNYDMVCVVEVRVSQKYQVLSEYFPAVNVLNAESFKYANKLIGTEKEQVISRLLGSYGYRVDPDFNFEPDMFFSSLSSEFGVFYEGTSRSSVKFKSGIGMPFYRIASQILRKKKILKTEKQPAKGKPIDVYLRSGGYLICAFNERESKLTEDQINFVYGAACTLRRLFIST